MEGMGHSTTKGTRSPLRPPTYQWVSLDLLVLVSYHSDYNPYLIRGETH